MIIGIDPGLNGAVVFLAGKPSTLSYPRLPSVFLCPTTIVDRWGTSRKTKKRKLMRRKEFDIQKMNNLLTFPDRIKVHTFLERARVMPKQGAVSAKQIGRGQGLWEALAVSAGFTLHLVESSEWFKEVVGKRRKEETTKEASVRKATRLFGKLILLANGKTPHDGIADALLIAEYGRRLLRKERA